MLQSMRKHARYFYVLFFIVILTFIFWGVGTVDQTAPVEIIAEVGKNKIMAEEYWKTYDRIYRFYREIYKDKFDEETEKKLNLKESVLDAMINEEVLLMAARQKDIAVSDKELNDAIVLDPNFFKDGVFDKDVYMNRLRLNRITPELYESMKRRELMVTKMKRFIELSADVMDANFAVPQEASGNEQVAMMLKQARIAEQKEKAVKSYIEGLKKNITIKINKDLIA
jgi:peptidyl-prolyl cis-trans isomerase D